MRRIGFQLRCLGPRAASASGSSSCSRITHGSRSPNWSLRTARRASGTARRPSGGLTADMPAGAADLVVKDYGESSSSPVAFSALPGDVAGEIEQRLAKAGHAVLSNSSTHRMEPDVPLMIAEVNPEHASRRSRRQKANRGWAGYIVTNGNCSAIHLTLTAEAAARRLRPGRGAWSRRCRPSPAPAIRACRRST